MRALHPKRGRIPARFAALFIGSSIHPIIRKGAALRISRLHTRWIVAIYLALFAVFDTLLSVVVIASRWEWGKLHLFPRYFILLMLAPANLLSEQDERWGFFFALYAAEVIRVILPVLLLGAFVFKLFQVDPLTWRRAISLESQLGGEPPVLRVRFYNSTASPLVNLRIQVFARVRSTGLPRNVQNVGLNISQGADQATKDYAFWALSRPGVPFTINVPLGRGLTAKEVFDKDEVVLPGQDEVIKRDRVNVFVLASGTSLETGTEFNSGHEYSLTNDLLLGHYAEVDVVYAENPKTWSGWDWFEENRELFVFGYASLVSPDSVARTVGHAVDPMTFTYARLAGWERAWSVGSDKSSHPERKFRQSDGSEFLGVTVVMGIAANSGSSCDGAVFPVTRGDLSILDVRERNYERIDISEQVTWAGKPEGCKVYTYEPTREALDRVVAASRERKELAIRAGYLELIREAFAQPGFPVANRSELASVPYPILDLVAEVDPSMEPVKLAALNSSYLQ